MTVAYELSLLAKISKETAEMKKNFGDGDYYRAMEAYKTSRNAVLELAKYINSSQFLEVFPAEPSIKVSEEDND